MASVTKVNNVKFVKVRVANVVVKSVTSVVKGVAKYVKSVTSVVKDVAKYVRKL